MFVIGDPGSTHCGDMSVAMGMIFKGYEAGLSALKFQMFPDDDPKYAGNVPLPYMSMYPLVEAGEEYGIEVFASVFDLAAVDVLEDTGARSVKLSYSMAESTSLLNRIADSAFETVYISGDVMTPWDSIESVLSGKKIVKLFCVPRYPVYEMLDLDAAQNTQMFDGFSDHTLGMDYCKIFRDYDEYCMAEDSSAPWAYWEKHVRPTEVNFPTPDSKFAVTFDQIKEVLR